MKLEGEIRTLMARPLKKKLFSVSRFVGLICLKPGYREQINQLTHWLDLSQVYGSSAEENGEVRAFSGTYITVDIYKIIYKL